MHMKEEEKFCFCGNDKIYYNKRYDEEITKCKRSEKLTIS